MAVWIVYDVVYEGPMQTEGWRLLRLPAISFQIIMDN